MSVHQLALPERRCWMCQLGFDTERGTYCTEMSAVVRTEAVAETCPAYTPEENQ